MKTIILVAGYATRLFPLTKDRPKALLDFWGKPVLTRIYEKLEAIEEIDEVYIVSNTKFYQNFCDWKETLNTKKIVKIVDDGTDSDDTKLGAIGDLDMAIKHFGIDDDIMVLLGDNLFTYELTDFYDYYKNKAADCICVKQVDDIETLRRVGVVQLEADGRVVDFVEKPQEPKSNKAAFGAYIYRRDTIPMITKYIEEGNNIDAPGNLPAWLYKVKPVYAFIFEGECFDIGTVDTYYEVIKDQKYLFEKD